MKKLVFSVRLPQELIDDLDRIASEVGHDTNRSNIITWACQWYVRFYRANGDRPFTETDMKDLLSYIRSSSIAPHHSYLKAADEASSYSKPSRKAGAQGSVDGGAAVQVADPRTSETCTKSRHQTKAQS